MNRAVLDYASRNRERLLFNTWRMATNSIERGREDSWTITPKRIEALEAAAKGGPVERSGAVDPKLYDTVLHDPAKRDARGYILTADQADLPTAVKFLNALIKAGVDVKRANKPFTVAGKTYPAGSFVVRADQAYRPHMCSTCSSRRTTRTTSPIRAGRPCRPTIPPATPWPCRWA
jgi:hypothetical protein